MNFGLPHTIRKQRQLWVHIFYVCIDFVGTYISSLSITLNCLGSVIFVLNLCSPKRPRIFINCFHITILNRVQQPDFWFPSPSPCFYVHCQCLRALFCQCIFYTFINTSESSFSSGKFLLFCSFFANIRF